LHVKWDYIDCMSYVVRCCAAVYDAKDKSIILLFAAVASASLAAPWYASHNVMQIGVFLKIQLVIDAAQVVTTGYAINMAGVAESNLGAGVTGLNFLTSLTDLFILKGPHYALKFYERFFQRRAGTLSRTGPLPSCSGIRSKETCNP